MLSSMWHADRPYPLEWLNYILLGKLKNMDIWVKIFFIKLNKSMKGDGFFACYTEISLLNYLLQWVFFP